MKNFVIYLFLALLFLVIDNTLLHLLFPPFLIPDVILIMVFYLGFNNRSASGALTAFSLGYLTDVFSAGVVGTSSFTLVFVFAVTSLLAKLISLDNMLVKIGGTAFMSIVKGTLTYLILRFLNQGIPFYIIFPAAIFTGIASPFVFNLLKRVELKAKSMGYSNY
ncbi:MAG: rod shape-determining protein MreD [Deltaproteobacteria bacterium]|nr:rod shape-determining protein MreD [Deltaproteobacteria bacterium]